MRSAFIAFLLLPAAVSAQTIQIDGGSGSLFRGSGAGATFYLPTSMLYSGVGYQQGRVVFGASDTFLFHNFKTTVGDENFGFSFDNMGLGLVIRGISIQRGNKHTRLTAFVGLSGPGYITPFVQTAQSLHVGTGVLIQHEFHGLRLSSLDAAAGGQHTAAQGIEYEYHRAWKLSGSGGLLNNQRYFDGVISGRTRWASLYAGHQSYFVPVSATSDNAGANFNLSRFTVQAAVNESRSMGVQLTGETIDAGFRFAFITEQSAWYKSRDTLIVHNITENLPHWTLTESIDQIAGRNSYSIGGEAHFNRFSMSISHSIQFLLNGRGYQSVTGISLSFRVHDVVLNANTLTDPFGRTLWSGYGETYIQAGMQLPGHETSHGGGKYLISGQCLSVDGSPVEGCAVLIGKDIVFSNSHGEFELYEKKNRAVTISVPTDQFSAPGSWSVTSSPTAASPGAPVQIVVTRNN